MCYGKRWSSVSFSIMFTAGIISLVAKAPIALPIACFFLSIKELIQLLLYYNLESCNIANKWLTVLAWIHISFQPFIVLLFISSFSKKKALYRMPLVLSIIYACFNVVSIKELYPLDDFKEQCKIYDKANSICRPQTCSYPGKYHLAYGFQLSSTEVIITPSFFTYVLLSFAVPYIIGDWQLATIHASVAIGSFIFAKENRGEAGAMWCLNSFWIGLVVIYYCVVKTRYNRI